MEFKRICSLLIILSETGYAVKEKPLFLRIWKGLNWERAYGMSSFDLKSLKRVTTGITSWTIKELDCCLHSDQHWTKFARLFSAASLDVGHGRNIIATNFPALLILFENFDKYNFVNSIIGHKYWVLVIKITRKTRCLLRCIIFISVIIPMT